MRERMDRDKAVKEASRLCKDSVEDFMKAVEMFEDHPARFRQWVKDELPFESVMRTALWDYFFLRKYR